MNSDATSDSIPLSSETTGTMPAQDLKIVENRIGTFGNWPLEFITPEQLATAGFYYLNIADQVKCAFCGGIIGQWEADDIPLLEHRKFFPDCPIVRQQELQQEEIGIQSVRTPKSPEYSTLESRTRSYANWDASVQDANVLAQAGFFYLGTGDEVRCFYCDGGLRNWLQTDDPWFEHTRWFPKCPYVMLVKGSNYIKSVIQRSNESGGNQSGNQSMQATPTMSVDDAMNTQAALEALSMGLNAGRVRAIMQRKINLTGRPFTSTEALVSAVLDGQIEDEGFESIEADRRLESQVTQLLLSAVSSVGLSNEDTERASSSANVASTSSAVPDDSPPAATTGDATSDSKPPKSPTDERRLKNVECKICMAEEVGVVFLPCGHLLSCVMCAPAMVTCPLCRQQIRGRVRTFLS